ncbi:hypothetical protein SNEBB_009367 [Seison nebaliae]|nr:hypothetical protein SNEBB_009367 [Seison nebaliae]
MLLLLVAVCLLEAKDVFGGRLRTEYIRVGNNKTYEVDVGGQWIGRTQFMMRRLLEELDIDLYEQYSSGNIVIRENNHRHVLSSFYSLRFLFDTIRLFWLQWKVDRWSNCFEKLPFQWLTQSTKMVLENCSNYLKSLITIAIRMVFGCEIDQLSLWYFLYYIAGADNHISYLIETDEAQKFRINGTTKMILKSLKNSSNSTTFVLNAFCTSVTELDGIVTVRYNDADTNEMRELHCVHAILALPITERAKLTMNLSLRPLQEEWHKFRRGNYIKFVVSYPKAFWRTKKFSGETISDCIYEKNEVVIATFDGCNENDRDVNLLVGFVAGDCANHLNVLSEVDIKELILEDLTRIFEEKDAMEPIDIIVQNWQKEKWIGGCPTFSFDSTEQVTKSTMTSMSKCTNHVLISGTESSDHWAGYMEGALHSSVRCIKHILKERNCYDQMNVDIYDYKRKEKSSKRFFYISSTIIIPLISMLFYKYFYLNSK